MITARFDFPDLGAKLKLAEGQIRGEIAVAMQTNRGMLFSSEGSYNGHSPWAPLLHRAGQILADRGVLKKSLAPAGSPGSAGPGGYVRTDDGGSVVIGTNVAYAKMMNFGTGGLPDGVLRPKNKKFLRFKSFGRYVFARSVKIPARRFDQINEQDTREIEAAMQAAIIEAFR